MQRRSMIGAGLALLGLGAAGGGYALWRRKSGRLPLPPLPPMAEEAAFLADFNAPLTPPSGPLRVFHIGHSLVGREMPAFLAQMAGHEYESQLGWGTSLREHWEERLTINGFDVENAHPRYRPARAALASGEYDALVLTEMSSVADSLRWHATPNYIAEWAKAARAGRPDIRVYLYQSWPNLDTPGGWEAQTDAQLPQYWIGEFLRRAHAAGSGPVHLIPAGAVLLAAVRAAEAGQIPGVTERQAFFSVSPEGVPDTVHMSDLGAWLVALTHFAVLYHQVPERPLTEVSHPDGRSFSLSPETAQALAGVVRGVIAGQPGTGVVL
ncbi:hypothetical protein [Falsigemmobacter faecalis]|uniref:SGNH/GDSL hydrolase family protein n=1 Tax=Falsigemmobacter faecalis TaxID=2488730 RepID=A0A3P3DVC1_9RHOB|nr:hypothetical protein [Falsigemmobacter faecalis]RRH77934.1 hypothetical protein EG244_02610 [Falsigemmobacter faecalis]